MNLKFRLCIFALLAQGRSDSTRIGECGLPIPLPGLPVGPPLAVTGDQICDDTCNGPCVPHPIAITKLANRTTRAAAAVDLDKQAVPPIALTAGAFVFQRTFHCDCPSFDCTACYNSGVNPNVICNQDDQPLGPCNNVCATGETPYFCQVLNLPDGGHQVLILYCSCCS